MPPRDYLSAADLHRIYGLSRGYVYKLASVYRWRRVRLHGMTWYLVDDIKEWDLNHRLNPVE